MVLVGVGLALALAALLVRTATRIDADVVVESGRRAVVRAPASGVLTSVAVVEGSNLVEGDTLAVLESPELEASRAGAASDVLASDRQGRTARAWGDAARSLERQAVARGAAARLEGLERRRERMVLRSPIAGVVSTRDLESAPGRWLREGDLVCEVEDLRTIKLALAALEHDVQEIRPGTEVRMLFAASPLRTLRALVHSVSAAAREPDAVPEETVDLVRRSRRVRVVVEIENPGGGLRPGMGGRAQFLTTRRSIAGKLLWHIGRWAGQVVW
jgi:multidrug resistance efflux pump